MALVDLRADHYFITGAFGDGARDSSTASAGARAAVFRNPADSTLPRSWQTAADLHHDLGLHGFFAATHHLVWRPCARKSVVSPSMVWRVGVDRPGADCFLL